MAENNESPTTVPEHDTGELVPKRGAVSAVWKFFGFKKDDVQQTTIICKCRKANVVAVGGNISNLLHHLIRKHVIEYQECMKLRSASTTSTGNTRSAGEKSSQTTLKDAFARGTAYDKKSKHKCRHLIVNGIILWGHANLYLY